MKIWGYILLTVGDGGAKNRPGASGSEIHDKLEKTKEREEQKRRQEEKERIEPDIRRIIEEGDNYIQRIHGCNDALTGREILAKISRMEVLVDRIFDRVEQNPESAGDIRRLMDYYYLPTTVKLLDAYQELDAQPVQGENILSSKKEIEGTLDTLASFKGGADRACRGCPGGEGSGCYVQPF